MSEGLAAGADLRARRRTRRRSRPTTAGLVAATVAVSAVLSGCAGQAEPPSPARSASDPLVSPATTAEPEAEPSSAPYVLGEGVEPASIRIPRIGLDEPLIHLGVKADGTMGVPADWDAVGWFSEGGKPGGRGPTVIAGHVDSVTAPAVFHRLDELVVGDTVEVRDIDGVTVGYTVHEVADFPKAEFPTARVFGAIPADELRLITCGGYFDPNAASYVENRVVFASRS